MANRGGIPRPGLPKDKRSSWIHPKFIAIVFHAVARVHDTLEGDMMDPDHLVTDEAAERWALTSASALPESLAHTFISSSSLAI